MSSYITNESRNAITALLRTLYRLGIINSEEFLQVDNAVAERNQSHLVGTHPVIMPRYRINKRR